MKIQKIKNKNEWRPTTQFYHLELTTTSIWMYSFSHFSRNIYKYSPCVGLCVYLDFLNASNRRKDTEKTGDPDLWKKDSGDREQHSQNHTMVVGMLPWCHSPSPCVPDMARSLTFSDLLWYIFLWNWIYSPSKLRTSQIAWTEDIHLYLQLYRKVNPHRHTAYTKIR